MHVVKLFLHWNLKKYYLWFVIGGQHWWVYIVPGNLSMYLLVVRAYCYCFLTWQINSSSSSSSQYFSVHYNVSSINRILFILLLDKMTHKHLRTYISKNVKLTHKMCSYYDTGITFRRKNGSRSSNPEQQVFSKIQRKIRSRCCCSRSPSKGEYLYANRQSGLFIVQTFLDASRLSPIVCDSNEAARRNETLQCQWCLSLSNNSRGRAYYTVVCLRVHLE